MEPPSPPQLISGHTEATENLIVSPKETFDDGILFYEYSLRGHVTSDGSDPISASFFFFNDRGQARRLYNNTMQANDENVVRPLICTYNNKIKRHIVGVYAIQGFLDPNDLAIYSKFSETVSENPDPFIQDKIRGIILGFKHLQSRGLSCSRLDSRGSFVWVDGELKILFADVSLGEEIYHSQTRAMRATVRKHMLNLSVGIRNHLLRGQDVLDSHWHQRFYFIKSFEANFSFDNDVHLQMIADHPFLEKNPRKILKMFFEVDHALDSTDKYSEYNAARLKDLLEDADFESDIFTEGSWKVSFSDEFDMFLKRDYDGKKAAPGTYPYKFTEVRSLIRCLKNLYCHYFQSPDLCDPSGALFAEDVVDDVGMTADDAYFEVKTNWPTLIPSLHVKVFQSKLVI